VSTIGETPIDLHITPIDGRNFYKLKILSTYFSERAINSSRIFVETEYLKWLSKYKIIRTFTKNENTILDTLSNLTTTDYQAIRDIESKTNHDAKAVELFIQQKLAKTTLRDVSQMIHFGLTSDDINSTAYARCINQSLVDVYHPILHDIFLTLQAQAKKFKTVPMLARTHGQPANGTTYGKELGIYAYRLKECLHLLKTKKISGKCSGNVGNFNAQYVIVPSIHWISFAKTFLSHIAVPNTPMATQIAPYDSYIQLFQTLEHINLILLGLSKDLWTYASFGLLTQKRISTEVGSTALPHKINPIYLEGAEGGFEIANSLLEGYVRKLSYSRLQRDLSDSTIRRSFSIMFSYCLLSYQSILEGLHRLAPNVDAMKNELASHLEILSEVIQTALRKEHIPDAYDTAKEFFRGETHTLVEIQNFIATLPLPVARKKQLLALSPVSYTGLAKKLVETYV